MSSLEEQFAQVLPSLIPRIPTKLLSERLLTTKNIARRSAPGYELNHQDLSSMICLWLLAAWFKPEVIVEAGTSHGLSLSTWIYYGAAEVHAIDITLQPWCAIQALSHLPTPDLTLHECCVTTIDFERIIRGRRALVFYDLHDVEERSLFEEVAIPRIFSPCTTSSKPTPSLFPLTPSKPAPSNRSMAAGGTARKRCIPSCGG